MMKYLCMKPPFRHSDFNSLHIGVDETNGLFGQVSIRTCKRCGQKWLHYQVEYEGFSESGRWYRGMIFGEMAKKVTSETAVNILEELEWHFYGGSYFKTRGKKGTGKILMDL